MIPKPLIEVSLADLQGLIASARLEDQRIEYKRTFPGAGDDRSPIIKTACAFANTQGGDLLIGVEAADGIPVNLVGVEIENVDATTLSLSNYIGDSTEPPIRDVHFQFIPVADNRYVIVIRSERSWARPHRLKRGNEFYARGTAGNYTMDISSVKRAILAGESISEHARSFLADRISALMEGSGPVKMHDNALLAMHLAPISSFGDGEWRVSPERWKARWSAFVPPTVAGGLTWEFHIDGFVAREINSSDVSSAYSLLFRNGILELVFWVGRLHEGRKHVSAGGVESLLVRSLTQFLPLLQSFDLSPPYLASFSLIKAKGHRLGIGDPWNDTGRDFDRDIYNFPWVTITDPAEDPAIIIRQGLDALWNAAGHEKSVNFTEQERQLQRAR